jgi:hypothetical protein
MYNTYHIYTNLNAIYIFIPKTDNIKFQIILIIKQILIIKTIYLYPLIKYKEVNLFKLNIYLSLFIKVNKLRSW